MPEIPRIPVGSWVETAEQWLKDNLSWFFDIVRSVIAWLIENLYDLLIWPEPIILIILFGALAWWLRGWAFALFAVAGFALVESMRLWSATMSTLALVLISTVIAAAIGVPVGIAAARNRVFSNLLRPLLDLMQTMPVFVYLIPAIVFFRVGQVPGVVATVVFALPPAVRLTELGIRQVDEEVVEAGHAFGASPTQILTRVQLPLALPTIMAGINQVIMLALSMVVIAGMVGAGGVGAEVYRAISRLQTGAGVEGGLAIVVLAVFLDRATSAISDRASRFQERT